MSGAPSRRRWAGFATVVGLLAAAWLYNHDGRSWREWVCQP